MLAPETTETELRELTWEYCGIARHRNGLEAAVNALDRAIWEPVGEPSLRIAELRNMHEVALLIARCALWREESRGAHYRTDFPEKREEFQRASAITRVDDSVTLVP
jgi:aspartate oxidase